MTAKTTPKTSRDVAAEVAFLTRALKAPTLRESVVRLTERDRTESWTHEEYLVACLQREVSARQAHGGKGRIRAARLPARKSLEEFDFDHARGLKRETIAHLDTLDFVAGARECGLPRADRDGDRLQHLRAVLPCEVRVTSEVHPLFGRLVRASSFKRLNGVLHLVVELPDGSPGTVRAEATDVLGVMGHGGRRW
jgi:hypothetical protein